jgi:PPOX class probable F420-dependent enzyme
MRMSAEVARKRFAGAPVARLATVRPDGGPHVVPVVFTLHDDAIVFAVDAKPKRTRDLQRLRNLAANSRASFLVDEYDDDWARLWWARADGRAVVVDARSVQGQSAIAALRVAHLQYRDVTLDGPVVITAIDRWTGWQASVRSSGP